MNTPRLGTLWRLTLLCTGLWLASPAAVMAVSGDTEAATQGWALIQDGAVLIDVRSAEEYAEGHIEGAINVPHSQVDELAQAIGADTSRPVVLYCGSGRRAGIAQQALQEMGYSEVFNASGYEALDVTRPQP